MNTVVYAAWQNLRACTNLCHELVQVTSHIQDLKRNLSRKVEPTKNATDQGWKVGVLPDMAVDAYENRASAGC